MVVDPGTLLAELAALDAQGIATGKLLISANAHLIMPWHKELDKLTERWLGRQQIGTTGQGIGPTYGDKVGRLGIRVQDLLDPGILAKKVEAVLRERNPLLAKVYNRLPLDAEAIVEEYATYAEALRPRIADTSCTSGTRSARAAGAVRGRPGDPARRRPRHLPVRHLLLAGGRRASPGPGSAQAGSSGSWASPRRT